MCTERYTERWRGDVDFIKCNTADLIYWLDMARTAFKSEAYLFIYWKPLPNTTESAWYKLLHKHLESTMRSVCSTYMFLKLFKSKSSPFTCFLESLLLPSTNATSIWIPCFSLNMSLPLIIKEGGFLQQRSSIPDVRYGNKNTKIPKQMLFFIVEPVEWNAKRAWALSIKN